jgi:hypothetical protein
MSSARPKGSPISIGDRHDEIPDHLNQWQYISCRRRARCCCNGNAVAHPAPPQQGSDRQKGKSAMKVLQISKHGLPAEIMEPEAVGLSAAMNEITSIYGER